MPRGRYQESMSRREAIESEMKAYGIKSEKEWKKAIAESELMVFLGEKSKVDTEKIEAFLEAEGNMDKLSLIKEMSPTDAMLAIQRDSRNPRGRDYLEKRLEFYEKLITGEAKRQIWEKQYIDGKFQDVLVDEYSIDSSNISKEDIETGLLRDMFFATMIGTPEMGVYKIAEKRIKTRKFSTNHMPQLRGHRSQICYESGDLGVAYPLLSKMYEESHEGMKRKYLGGDVSEKKLEHKAVAQAAKWLADAMDYNDPNRVPESTHASSIEEAIAWARLGSTVQRQLRGMRQKIEDVNLENIGRFIGKSGDSRFDQELRDIKWQISHFDDLAEDGGGAFLEKQNNEELEKQNKWQAKETDRLQQRLEKQLTEIEKMNFPREEHELQKTGLQNTIDEQLAVIKKDYEERVVYFENRTNDQMLSDLKERKESLEAKANRKKSLAKRAVDLHFVAREYYGENVDPPIDWINEAPFGLIKWTSRGIEKGVRPETVLGYATAQYAFPNTEISYELIKKASSLSKSDLHQIQQIKKINSKRGISATPEELCSLGKINISRYESLIDKGYTKEALLKNRWLDDEMVVTRFDLFPFDGTKGQQQTWCVNNAFYLPEGWQHKRLGNVILGRLNAGIDGNLHDATYWLKEFEVPDEKNGVVYRDIEKEINLLYSMTNIPEKLKGRVPSKPNKYGEFFSNDATLLAYAGMIEQLTDEPMTFDQVEMAVRQKLTDFKEDPKKAHSIKTPFPKLEEQVEKVLSDLKIIMQEGNEREKIPILVADLKKITKARKTKTDDAQKWVAAHSSTPRDLLTLAWANRDLALAEGIADNPRAIKQWADLNSLRASFTEMEQSGRLPANIGKEDLMKYSPILNELVRCYDGRKALETLSRLKERFNPKFEIPPMRISLGGGWSGEVLQKNDPRGMTIGYDTGCCMTLSGASESCIHIGYEKPQYGFFALYKDNGLVAQSFIYTNTKDAPDTIVCDNIEANQGRDFSKVVPQYNEFWRRYMQMQARRNPDAKFTRVQIGTGYTEVGLEGLKSAKAISMENPEIYTDAHKQKLLLEMDQKEIDRLKKLKAETSGDLTWNKIRDQIMNIEQSAFREGGYSEDQLEQEFSNPDSVAVVLKDGRKIVGYSTAIPDKSDKKGETLYISSTALLPDYRGKGLVSDVMFRLDIEAQKRGYKYYTRDARVDNGYIDKIKRNYEVVEEGEVKKTIHGLQQHVKVVVPSHGIIDELDGTRKIEHREPVVQTKSIGIEQAAVIAELEKAIYPSELRQGQDYFEDELEFEEGEEWTNASFILTEKREGNEDPIGYAVGYVTEAETDYENSVLYIADTAILPGYQKQGHGKKMFEKIIQFAESHQGMAIEFHARSSTSYPALKHSETYLKELGYQITYDEEVKNYFNDEDVQTDESVHLLRLERINSKNKKAA
ncbi:GNAT family N-acetyltransferase [Patescibacteria group bacterium]